MITLKFLGFFLTLFSWTSIRTIFGYDIRCIYPENMIQDPFEARYNIAQFHSALLVDYELETPVMIHIAHQWALCQGSCLAYHDEDVLDPHDLEPTFVTVPPFGQNAYAMNMCAAQCYLHVNSGFSNFTALAHEYMHDTFGLNVTYPETRMDIFNAWVQKEVYNNIQPMMGILEAEDYHPLTMGHVIGFKVRYYMETDGWNFLGDETYSTVHQVTVPCSSSCRVYQDTTGYEPVLDPLKHPNFTSINDCASDCKRWQPLQEGDSIGNLKHQEFIVPHIGEKAKTYLRQPSLTLDDPDYDLTQESLLVVERLRASSFDQYQKDSIKFFDNKLKVRGVFQQGMKVQLKEGGIHSYQDHVLWLLGLSAAEYDGIIQAWHEKRHHDLVRPTTVIKRWNNVELYTYGGDRTNEGPVYISARDFEAFVRVMPHPEFPSGSSCLCTTYYEFTDIYTTQKYNMTLQNLEWNNRVPQNWDPNADYYILQDMEELRDVCGDSRLWGGMHYTAAIEAGNQVCSGLGQLAYDYIEVVKNSSMFDHGDGPWYNGTELGECPN